MKKRVHKLIIFIICVSFAILSVFASGIINIYRMKNTINNKKISSINLNKLTDEELDKSLRNNGYIKMGENSYEKTIVNPYLTTIYINKVGKEEALDHYTNFYLKLYDKKGNNVVDKNNMFLINVTGWSNRLYSDIIILDDTFLISIQQSAHIKFLFTDIKNNDLLKAIDELINISK